ncbi:ImmA/IrrE family metallo-endopeptidase [Streptococcus pneumoniae]|nr:ImmA/IrrE family metallo-endopeptidase [Streptococcus pneumoniae]
MDRKTIKETVDNLINELQLSPPINLDSFFTYFSNLEIAYDVKEIDLLDGKITKKDGNGYVVSLSCNKGLMNERDRFTLAHELGHLFLGHVDRHETLYRRGANKLEYEANEFAAEMLMPQEAFVDSVNDNIDADGVCDIGTVAKYFGVSPSAAVTRGKFLGLFAW